jgi:putative membrane protein
METKLSVLLAAGLLTACQSKAPEATDNTDQMAAANDMTNESASMTAAIPAQQFVDAIAASDMFEIESGKLAESKATTDDLKAFGKMLQTDHAKSTDMLKAAIAKASPAPTVPASLPSDMQSKLEALRQASGSAFDQLFTQQQIEGHQKALAELQSYGTSGDQPSLVDFAKTAQTVVKSHLDKISSMPAH